jgi:recombining binding protein (suppressor of hairless)
MHSQQFDQPETMDVSEHSNYNVFSNSPQSPSFPSSRYRSNNSPSSALSYNYPMSPDNMYPSTPFGESVTQFNSSTSQYDMLQSTPYGSGKVSPLTPNDPAGSMSHSYPALASQKDYAQPSSYPDMLPERRLGSGNFQPDFHDEYVNGGNNQMPFSPSGVAPFTRYQDNRFPHSPTAPATVPSHMHHGSDTLRSIHPHRHEGNGMTGYDEIPHYLAPNPHTDLSLRMPVDETLARLKLHTHSPGGMSSATDLQSFIRFV